MISTIKEAIERIDSHLNTIDEMRRVRLSKDKAVEEQEYEKAASLRDEYGKLADSLLSFKDLADIRTILEQNL